MIEMKPGSVFGDRYEIMKCVGAGGMGAVYLACDPRYRDFLVALKVLYPGVIKSADSRERFRNEIVASYRVNHKNVVRAYEYFDQDEVQAFAMEYVDGGDLSERMMSGTLSNIESISILKQIASGLQAVHAEGITHRDLKPENILLTKKGVVKLSDFGVARLKGAATLTQAGAMVGTPKYVSPEYIETGECDHRGDIYALGVIGYELLSGKSPFNASSRVSMLMERFEIDPNELYKLAPTYPKDLLDIILRAMSVDLNHRYSQAVEVKEDIERVERGERPSFADPSSIPVSTSSSTRRESVAIEAPVSRSKPSRRTTMAAAGLVSLIFAIGVVAMRFTVGGGAGGAFSSLSDGVYTGTVTGAITESERLPISLWKTSKGVYVLLGKAYCKVRPLDRNNRYNCGDLSFQFDVSSTQGDRILGTVEETGWNTKGSWSLEKNEMGERA